MKSYIGRNKKTIIIIFVLSLYVYLLQVSKIYSPLTYFFGIITPTTGTTRAWRYFIRGDITSAFRSNHLFFLSPVFVFLYYKLAFKNEKKYTKAIIYVSIVYFIYFLIRNIFWLCFFAGHINKSYVNRFYSFISLSTSNAT